MPGMQFFYTSPGGTEQNLLADGVTYMLSYDGFGMPRRGPESTRLPLMDGVHHLDDEIYMPERYMHLELLVEGANYSAWKTADDALLAKLIGTQETNEMGTLRIVKPNGDQRTIQCALLEYPNDRKMTIAPTSSRRILTFYAPSPHFLDTVPSQTLLGKLLVDMTVSGYLYPAIFPWGGYAEMGCLTNTVVNAGNAKAYPQFWLWGPAANPLFYNATTEEWLQIPVTIPANHFIAVYFDTGKWSIVPVDGPVVWNSTFVLGSTLWQLQVGSSQVLIAAEGLDPTQAHIEYHYSRYKAL